mgnify:CR=1 FL=1
MQYRILSILSIAACMLCFSNNSNAQEITALAKDRFVEERSLNHLEGWFLAKEIGMECDEIFKNEPDCIRIAKTQVEVMKKIAI